MQTSCPECGTTFRVSQEQLGLRRGLVRCGRCNAVFNAYDTLLPELEEAPVLSPHPAEEAFPKVPEAVAPEDQEADAVAEVQAAYEEAGIPVVAAGALAPAAETEQDSSTQLPSAEAEPEPPEEEIPPSGEVTADAETPESILLSDLPNRLERNRPRPPKWKSALYGLVILLLFVTLTGQVFFFLRGQLAAALPGSRPWLNALCRPLDCVVPLPEQLSRQNIVSSSLEHDTEQNSRVRLTFLLANRTAQTQAWPHILLTLSDVRESPVAQKAFAPELYLPKGVSVRAGFPAQSEQEARVDLDIGGLAASSYILDVAYP